MGVLALSLLGAAGVGAEDAGSRVALDCQAVDSQGNAIGGARFEARDKATNAVFSGETDDKGELHLLLPDAGTYAVAARMTGLRVAELGDVVVSAADVPQLRAVLRPLPLTAGGWTFLVVSLGFVWGLTAWCFRRVLTAPQEIEVPPAALGG